MVSKIKKHPRRYLCFLLVIIFLSTSSIIAKDNSKINITFNSHKSGLPYELKDNRIMVPLRAAFEITGANVTWDQVHQKINITRGNKLAAIKIGDKAAVINGKTRILEETPYQKDSVTMVHIKVLEETLDCFLEWDQKTASVNIWDDNFVGADKMEKIINSITFTALPPTKTINLTGGTKYIGHLVDGKLNGNGKITWPDGSSYNGQWKDGLYHGYGSYTYPNKDNYTGEFKNGKHHGSGTYIYASGNTIKGIWENGRCIKAID